MGVCAYSSRGSSVLHILGSNRRVPHEQSTRQMEGAKHSRPTVGVYSLRMDTTRVWNRHALKNIKKYSFYAQGLPVLFMFQHWKLENPNLYYLRQPRKETRLSQREKDGSQRSCSESTLSVLGGLFGEGVCVYQRAHSLWHPTIIYRSSLRSAVNNNLQHVAQVSTSDQY